eukprot:1145767-Pelagomonas_calceolata.AAC.1
MLQAKKGSPACSCTQSSREKTGDIACSCTQGCRKKTGDVACTCTQQTLCAHAPSAGGGKQQMLHAHILGAAGANSNCGVLMYSMLQAQERDCCMLITQRCRHETGSAAWTWPFIP